MAPTQTFDGSRRHVLDWVDSPGFLIGIRQQFAAQGWSIPQDANWMPFSGGQPAESKLFDKPNLFLSKGQQKELREWWLAPSGRGNIPNWDLILTASTATGTPALVLVEAKAHTAEFDRKPKKQDRKASQDSLANHATITAAIEEANRALHRVHSSINISIDKCYQFANRIAMAWKLASMGIPNTIVFLGFTGDSEIAKKGKFFPDDAHWQNEFSAYIGPSFPMELLNCDIPCGAASFRLISHSLPVITKSRPLEQRRAGQRAAKLHPRFPTNPSEVSKNE